MEKLSNLIGVSSEGSVDGGNSIVLRLFLDGRTLAGSGLLAHLSEGRRFLEKKQNCSDARAVFRSIE